MSELRRDPVSGRWVIVAEDRLARPNEYGTPPSPSANQDCPFCEGREERTPPEVESDRPAESHANQPGWTVRVIPNRFPTVARDAAPVAKSNPSDLFPRLPGTGIHEVIIQSPNHEPALPLLPFEHRRRIFEMYRRRFRALASEPAIKSVLLFENGGPESGGTLYHPHGQAVALPMISPILEEEMAGAAQWASSHEGACVWDSIASAERSLRVRLVSEDESLIAFAPWASHYPYEVVVMPVRHATSFSEASEEELNRLAEVIPELLRALLQIESHGSYNYFLHSTSTGTKSPNPFHWHFHLAPRLVRPDGFELGAGIAVNPVRPEVAAERLREARKRT